MKILIEISFLILAYLIGSIPFALIITKVFYKKDIREYGSKNMGATNVTRVFGIKVGIIVFLLDAIKGSLVLALFNYGIINRTLISHIPLIALGLSSTIGHIFPIFANFKGGKGVACTAGILAFYNPISFIIVLTIFLITVAITKYVSVGSILLILSAFILSFFIPPINHSSIDVFYTIYCGLLLVVLIITHRKNIVRLFNGTESKISKGFFSSKE